MTHVKMSDQWNCVVEDFERNNPELAEEVVDWYPVGQMEIAIKLRNGKRLIYEFIGNIIRPYYQSERMDSIDENVWRSEFAIRLNKKMRNSGMSQYDLSDRTGISSVTLSKYMNGKATPSGYNLDKIAKAFKCSASEFMNIQ